MSVKDYKTLEDYMSEYYHNPIENYDCSEIAEDLKQLEPNGKIVTVRMDDGSLLKVEDHGRVVEWEYHTFFVFEGEVYDPNYSKCPVSENKYYEHLYNLNPNLKGLKKSNSFGI